MSQPVTPLSTVLEIKLSKAAVVEKSRIVTRHGRSKLLNGEANETLRIGLNKMG